MRVNAKEGGQSVTKDSGDEILLGTEPLWTVEEVARYLRLSPGTVRAMARRGELPARKIGRVWRFAPKVVKAFVRGRKESLQVLEGDTAAE